MHSDGDASLKKAEDELAKCHREAGKAEGHIHGYREAFDDIWHLVKLSTAFGKAPDDCFPHSFLAGLQRVRDDIWKPIEGELGECLCKEDGEAVAECPQHGGYLREGGDPH